MKATKGRAAEVQSAAKAQENDSAPGVQPEAPSRATHPYREVRERNTLMSHSATTTTAPSTPTDQRVRLVLEAEIFQDPDGGPDSLIVTNDKLACEPIVPARFRGLIADARAELDRMERLVLEHEARDTLRAILAEHDLELEELDASTLPEKIRNGFGAFHCKPKNGRGVIVVPQGQDPIERVNFVADLANRFQAHTEAEA